MAADERAKSRALAETASAAISTAESAPKIIPNDVGMPEDASVDKNFTISDTTAADGIAESSDVDITTDRDLYGARRADDHVNDLTVDGVVATHDPRTHAAATFTVIAATHKTARLSRWLARYPLTVSATTEASFDTYTSAIFLSDHITINNASSSFHARRASDYAAAVCTQADAITADVRAVDELKVCIENGRRAIEDGKRTTLPLTMKFKLMTAIAACICAVRYMPAAASQTRRLPPQSCSRREPWISATRTRTCARPRVATISFIVSSLVSW